MSRSLTGFPFPVNSGVFNAPILKSDENGIIENQPAPDHQILIGGGTEVNSITGTAGQLLISRGPSLDPAFVNTTEVPIPNLAGGAPNQIPYQVAADTTSFISAGTDGQVIVGRTNLSPQFKNKELVEVGLAENLKGGIANSIPVQLNDHTTSFIPTVTMTNGEIALDTTYVLTQNDNVNPAAYRKDLVLGDVTTGALTAGSTTTVDLTSGAISSPSILSGPLQGAPFLRSTSLGAIAPGTVLGMSAGGTGNTLGEATAATNIKGGSAFQIPYQQIANATFFISAGSTGEVLAANTGGPPGWTNSISGSIINPSSSISVLNVTGTTKVSGGLVEATTNLTAPTASIAGAVTTGAINAASVNAAGAVVAGADITTPGIMTSGSIVTGAVACGAVTALGVGCAAVACTSVTSAGSIAGTTISGTGITASSSLKDTSQAQTGGWPLVRIDATGRFLGTTPADVANIGADFIRNGSANKIVYQTGVGSTDFLPVGTTNQVLTGNTGAAPSWVNTSALSGVIATDIAGGNAGELAVQQATGDTTFISSGGTSTVLCGNGTGTLPSWKGSFQIKSLTLSNVSSPVANPLVINSSGGSEAIQVNTTSNVCGLRINIPSGQPFNSIFNQASTTQDNLMYFFQNGGTKSSNIGQKATTNNFRITSDNNIELSTSVGKFVTLTSADYAGAAYLSTNSSGNLIANSSLPTTIANLSGGTTGQIPYQSAPNTTTFCGPGNVNDVLQSNGAGFAPSFVTVPQIKALTLYNVTAPVTNALGLVHNGAGEAFFITTNTGTKSIAVVHAGSDTAVDVSCTTNVIPLKLTQTASQITSILISQPSISGASKIIFQKNAGAAESSIGVSATSNLELISDNNIILQCTQLSIPVYSAPYLKTDINGVISAGVTTPGTGFPSGSIGQLLYQSASNTTSFLTTGTTGQFLTGVTSGAPAWANISSISAGSSALATNIAGGSANQLVYQSATDTTAFLGPGTSGQLLQSNGASPPAYVSDITIKSQTITNTSSPVSTAQTVTHSGSGPAVQINCNSFTVPLEINNNNSNGTAFLNVSGDYNNVITFKRNGATKTSYLGQQQTNNFLIQDPDEIDLFAPLIKLPDTNYLSKKYLFTNSSGNLVGGSSINVTGGSAGQVLYQSAVDTTGFVTGVAGRLLQSNGSSAPTFVEQVGLKTVTLTNTSTPVANPLIVNSSGAGEAVQVNMTSNACGLRINIPSGQPFNSIFNQASTTQDNLMYFFQNGGTKSSNIGQKATTNKFKITSDSGLELDAPNYKFNQLTTAGYVKTDSSGNVSVQSFVPKVAKVTQYVGPLGAPGARQTHTLTSGCTGVEIWICGGGGGGGSGSGLVGGTGGGGASTVYKVSDYTVALPYTALEFYLGDGGAGGTGGGDGVNGETSAVRSNNSPTYTIDVFEYGGTKGNGASNSGGAPGTTSSGGTMSYEGGFGGFGGAFLGGSSHFGGTQRNAGVKGSGGGGADISQSGYKGGPGYLLIKEYF